MTRFQLGLLVVCACAAAVSIASAQESGTDVSESAEVVEHEYVGVAKCKTCHGKEEIGDQVAVWMDGPHANALDSLATGLADEWAAEAGVDDPTTDEACVRCHTTASGVSDDLKGSKFSHDEGVTCEACHGAGKDYRKKKIMVDHDAAVRAGLVEMSEAVCVTCHNSDSPAFDGFDYARALKKIAHPVPENHAAFEHPMVGRDESDPSCTTCHERVPATGAPVAEAELVEEPDELCETCHDQPRHLGASQHVGVVPTKALPNDPQRFALAPDGTIQCWTCHEVHGDGLQVSSTAKDGSKRTVAAAIRARLLADEWDGLVPADAVWPTTQESERRSMLTLPVDDGQLCAGCHDSGPVR